MTGLGKGVATALLLAAFAMQSGAAQAQCSATNPACQPSQPGTGTGGSSGGGGGNVGIQVDVGSAAKAIGGLFKKKKKPVEPTVNVATTPVEQPKPQIVFVPSAPVVRSQPRAQAVVQPRTQAVAKPRVVTPPKTVAAVRRPPTVRKVTPKVVAPVAAAVTAPVIEPEVVAAPPLPEPIRAPAPAIEIVEPAAPVAKAATISAPAEAPKSDNKLYLMIAAAVAALAAAGTAAKFMFMPKVSMDCSIPDATSLLVSNPSLTPPEVTFNVALPEFAASTPDNIAIVA